MMMMMRKTKTMQSMEMKERKYWRLKQSQSNRCKCKKEVKDYVNGVIVIERKEKKVEIEYENTVNIMCEKSR